MNFRIVFMGSPEFAVPVLQGLASAYPVVGVITQPDRPSGRGGKLTPPPVKTAAAALGLEICQPERLRDAAAFAVLERWKPDIIIVAAYGQILRQNILDLPRFGCINVHASLLPRWRGAAPIQAAILHGDSETGISIMKMDSGIDTGPILFQEKTPILPDDTGGRLTERLANLGADCLLRVLPGYLTGEIRAIPQPNDGATYAPPIQKADRKLDLSSPVIDLERKIRAFNPSPGVFIDLDGEPLKIQRAHVKIDEQAQPAVRTQIDDQPAIGARGGWIVLDEVQPAGKRPMPGKAFLLGARNWRSKG